VFAMIILSHAPLSTFVLTSHLTESLNVSLVYFSLIPCALSSRHWEFYPMHTHLWFITCSRDSFPQGLCRFLAEIYGSRQILALKNLSFLCYAKNKIFCWTEPLKHALAEIFLFFAFKQVVVLASLAVPIQLVFHSQYDMLNGTFGCFKWTWQ